MSIDIDVGASGTKETALRRAYWNLADMAVLSRTTVLPGSPTNGDIYIIVDSDLTNPNKIAFRSEGTWLTLTPHEGWTVYVKDTDTYARFDGTNWLTIESTTTEVLTGTSALKTVTPDALAALWEKGGDITSASTITIGEGGFFHVTGTVTITDIDWSTAKDGRWAWIVFDGILTLTHNGTTLKLPTGANITTAAGDRALFIQDNSDNAICLSYIRADGTPVATGSIATASTTNVLTGTSSTTYATPDAIAALWEKGADIASASTITIGEGGYAHVTGTVTITDIDWSVAKDGRCTWLIFDGILTLTHHSTTLKLPSGTNITTAAGDRALFVEDASDNVICLTYVRSDGTPVATGSVATASTTDVRTGTSTTTYTTPDSIAALWEKGGDITSASTITIGEGGYFHVTGTTTITDIDWSIPKDGRWAWIIFDGALTLTHNSTTLKLPTGANITTVAGDRALFIEDNSDNVICLAYIRADGTALTHSSIVTISDSAPGSPSVGDLWWESSTGALFIYFNDGSSTQWVQVNAGGVVGTPFELEVACSDESTALTTGDNKVVFWAPMNATISEVFTAVGTQSSSGVVTTDLNKNGSTMFSTKPSIDANEDTSLTGTAAVLSTLTWTKGDKLAVDLDAAGTGAKGLKMIIRGTRS